MKNFAFIFMVSLFLTGCSARQNADDIALKINHYAISKAEFEEAFKESSLSGMDTPQARQDFMDNLVNRMLILQEAQKRRLDRDPKFLKMVEKFWMQSLLRLAIENKAKELGAASLASDEEARFMNEWLTQLHKGVDIKINNDLISR